MSPMKKRLASILTIVALFCLFAESVLADGTGDEFPGQRRDGGVHAVQELIR